MLRFRSQRARNRLLVCTLLAMTLLMATGQYLSHFHVPQVAGAQADEGPGHSAEEHCSLCLQFDRLPAPSAPAESPVALFTHIATVEAERLERLALDPVPLWPPSRGPPALTC